MNVSVIEALRIQKEVAQSVQKTMSQENRYRYGVTKEEDVVLDIVNANTKTFPEFLDAISKLFKVSQQINAILSEFSVKNGISNMVRERENMKVLQRVYENAIANLPVATITRFEIVGTTKTKVTRTFEPFVSKKDMKDRLKIIKSRIREIQADIDTKNAQVIELPFEYEDIELLNDSED